MLEIDLDETPMEAHDRIKKAQQEAAKRLADLDAQQATLTEKIQAVRREMAEYEAAMRVLSRVYGTPEPATGTGIRQITGKDAMYEIVKQSPKAGLRASFIRERAEQRFGISIAVTSGSNYLWSLHQEGKIRREGHKWFLPEKTEAPAVTDTSGEKSHDLRG